jgi:hypothetical protein
LSRRSGQRSFHFCHPLIFSPRHSTDVPDFR